MNPEDLIYYINEGRREVAQQSGCLRYVPPNLVTVAGQEKYDFADIDLSGYPGTTHIYAVRSIAVIWGNFRYVINRCSWGRYQSMIRNLAGNWQFIPSHAAQFGQGTQGSIYLYPVPSEELPMEWDCSLIPADLKTDSDEEPIPDTWHNPVRLYAAYLATTVRAAEATNAQQAQVLIALSDRYWKQYEAFMKRARAYTTPGTVSSWYSRSAV
jgi:hypothetical protein